MGNCKSSKSQNQVTSPVERCRKEGSIKALYQKHLHGALQTADSSQFVRRPISSSLSPSRAELNLKVRLAILQDEKSQISLAPLPRPLMLEPVENSSIFARRIRSKRLADAKEQPEIVADERLSIPPPPLGISTSS